MEDQDASGKSWYKDVTAYSGAARDQAVSGKKWYEGITVYMWLVSALIIFQGMSDVSAGTPKEFRERSSVAAAWMPVSEASASMATSRSTSRPSRESRCRWKISPPCPRGC